MRHEVITDTISVLLLMVPALRAGSNVLEWPQGGSNEYLDLRVPWPRSLRQMGNVSSNV